MMPVSGDVWRAVVVLTTRAPSSFACTASKNSVSRIAGWTPGWVTRLCVMQPRACRTGRPETVHERAYARPDHDDAWSAGDERFYVLGPNPDERLIYAVRSGGTTTVRYPHTDIRGSTVALSQGGMAVEAYAYDEFGQGGPTGTSGYPFRYTGQRLDPWTGTYHYKAREYSPRIGRSHGESPTSRASCPASRTTPRASRLESAPRSRR